MTFVVEHWGIIVAALIILGGVAISVWRFQGLSEAEKINQIKAWLLQAVLLAEKQYGGGTGKLKLSSVYSEFCAQLPWLAKVITFEAFSGYVDEALEKMRDILANNSAIAAVVEGGEKNG